MLSKTLPKDGLTESLLSTGLNNKVAGDKMGLALWGFRCTTTPIVPTAKTKPA